MNSLSGRSQARIQPLPEDQAAGKTQSDSPALTEAKKEANKPKEKTSIEKVWITFLLKEWKDNNQIAATILIGSAGGVKDCTHRMNKAHIDDSVLIARYKDPKLPRYTYNATLDFRSELVYDLYPFQVHRLLCEWEVQGCVDDSGAHKFSLAVPRLSQENAKLSLTNFISIKKDVFKGIVRGSQDVYVDVETTKNSENYYPRVYIRFLQMGNTSRKIFLFYFPFSVLWLLALLSTLSGNELSRSDFINLIIGLVLTIAVGSSSMIDDQNYKELVLFNVGVLLFVAMAVPSFHYAVYLPGVMWLWLPISYCIHVRWLSHYTGGRRRFRTVETKEMKAMSKFLTNEVRAEHLYAVPEPAETAVPCGSGEPAPPVVFNAGTKEDCLCTSLDEAFDLGLMSSKISRFVFGEQLGRFFSCGDEDDE